MSGSGRDDLRWKVSHGDAPYDREESVRLERACEAFRRHAECPGSGRRYRILDVGCGIGPLRRWLPAERFEIVGLDRLADAVAIAREHYDECKVADLERDWPVEPASFDGVHAGAFLEHVADWHGPLNQANRALRQEGLIVASVPNLRYWKEIRRLIRGGQPHWLKDVQHLHAYTPRFLCELISLHGFKVVDLQADRVNLPLLKWCDRWLARRLAGIGSVLIVSARLQRRVRIEDEALKASFPNHRPVALRSIEVLPRPPEDAAGPEANPAAARQPGASDVRPARRRPREEDPVGGPRGRDGK